ncbi:nicotinate-nucleotide adenylyltransferase [Terriglobus aquaticus]
MRIGYFGGSFDPPHRGHLLLARLAADAFHLDRVLFAPTGRQPLKDHIAHAEFADRMAMVRLLCASEPGFEVVDLDAPHPHGSPNYTVDALEELRRREPDADLFALAGADSFLSLPRWRDPQRLLELAEWIVVSRPEFPLEELDALGLTAEQRARVHVLNTLHDDTSATEIRARLRYGVTPADRLKPEVLLYIARMHLYHAR